MEEQTKPRRWQRWHNEAAFKKRLKKFLDKVHVNMVTGCWEWQACRDRDGYGIMAVEGSNKKAHRFAYETWRDPIPEGLIGDHQCRHKFCVNPYHIEPDTNPNNILNGEGITAVNKRKTHCIHGHAFDLFNTVITKDEGPKKHRKCRACAKIRSQAYDKRKKLNEATHRDSEMDGQLVPAAAASA